MHVAWDCLTNWSPYNYSAHTHIYILTITIYKCINYTWQVCVCGVLFLLWPWIGLIQKTMATLWFLTAQGHRSFETCLQNCKIPVPIPGRNLTCRSSLLEVGTIQDHQNSGGMQLTCIMHPNVCSWLFPNRLLSVHQNQHVYHQVLKDIFGTKRCCYLLRGEFAWKSIRCKWARSFVHYNSISVLFVQLIFYILNIRSPITPPKHGAVVVFQEMRRQREPMPCRCWFQATWRRRWLGFN